MPMRAQPPAWQGLPSWRVLDTDWGHGLAFLRCWQHWRDNPQRPRMLHYVALCPHPPESNALQALQALSEADPALRTLADALMAQLSTEVGHLEPGFHRFMLDADRVLLTLCIGAPQAQLRELQFSADSVHLAAASATPWDRWLAKALARCCRRGTTLSAPAQLPTEERQHLQDAGFVFDPQTPAQGQFNPPWALQRSRELRRYAVAPVRRCVVIGAGLAGASVAAALARRGWQVQVLDRAATPAAGASGLPVGLLVPHVSRDDSPRSRLSRAGVRLTLQHAHTLLQAGQDWLPSGVEERLLDEPTPASRWHGAAAWIRPAKLVEAWLAQPGVRFTGNAAVARLRRHAAIWDVLDATGQLLAQAEHVVLANASGVVEVLQNQERSTHDARGLVPQNTPNFSALPALQGLRGVVSWGLQSPAQTATLPPHPVNGLGSLIAHIPSPQGPAWYAGATYENVAQDAAPLAAHHQTNFDKLQRLLPNAAQALAADFAAGTVQAWRGTRCVSPDRMPWVGALEPGPQPTLWCSVAMGSRGLSFALLCAELLAAQLGGEPWPITQRLALSLCTGR